MNFDNILAKRLPAFCRFLFLALATIGTFVGGAWASIGIGGALLMFFAVWRLERHLPLPRPDLTALIFAVLITAAFLNEQSFRPLASWIMWLRLVTIFLPLMVLSNARLQARVLPGDLFTTPLLAALVAVSGFALSLEIFLGGPLLHLLRGAHPLTWYNRGISYVAVLVFPIMAGLWVSNKRSAVLLFALAFLVPMAMTESRAAKMAYALGLLVVLLASFMPLLTRRALTFFIFLCPLWPFAVQKFFLARHDLVMRLPASWHDRVDIWDNMSYRILEHPWLGWGLTTSHFLPCSEPHGALYLYPMQCPGHPHNAIIQLWVDLGIPGLLFGLIFAFLVLFWIGKLDRRIMPFALGAFAAALSLSFVAYDFWTDSLFSMFAMAIFAFALLETKIANDFKTKPVFPVLQA